jgi:predicted glycogen debranching enzyme
MSYINFDKTKLINLSYSLNRELIRSNRAGSYACTTIIGSNTRKYHGLLVCPVKKLDNEYQVLLSGLHETIIQHDHAFNLGIHKYAGDHYNPRGHKYLRDFDTDPIPRLIYRVGGVILSREVMLAQNEERILIRYTMVDTQSPVLLRFKPFLAFRNIHDLSKANMEVITKIIRVKNGVKTRMYENYPFLFMQFSKDAEFVGEPDWYYNIEYIQEQKRGYDYKEDLYVPGYFELPLKKGETLVFSAGTAETDPSGLKRKFKGEISKRIPRNTFHNCLLNSAQQFLIRKGKKTEVIAGFPWYGQRTRDTFAALPGLTLTVGDMKTFRSVLDAHLDSLLRRMNKPVEQPGGQSRMGADEPLWFFWALQQFAHQAGDFSRIWESYVSGIKKVLDRIRKGIENVVVLHDNGLLFCGEPNVPLTWMDSVVEGVPVTPRWGYVVEVNALWYNALKFSLKLAEAGGDNAFINKWQEIPSQIAVSFIDIFWDQEKGYLADYVTNDFTDWSVRPNQVLAASMPYRLLDNDMIKRMLEVISSELLTPKGLRTLSPKNPAYRGIYEGDRIARDSSAHQGAVYPWLLGHYAEAYLRLYKKSGVDNMKRLFNGFEEDMQVHGVGAIAELYDGDPPHYSGGALSYAWNVAELLRMEQIILYYQNA